MNFELIPWTQANPDDIARIFNDVDRSFLADGLPTPYTRADVERWLSETVLPNEGTRGLFRFICVDGKCAGDVQLHCKEGAYRRDADLGYVLLDEYKGRGVMTEAVGRICAEAFERGWTFCASPRASTRPTSPPDGCWRRTASGWREPCAAPCARETGSMTCISSAGCATTESKKGLTQNLSFVLSQSLCCWAAG